MMVEDMAIRAISRMTSASKNTVAKLLEDAGEAFSDYQDRTLRNLTCKRVQTLTHYPYPRPLRRPRRAVHDPAPG